MKANPEVSAQGCVHPGDLIRCFETLDGFLTLFKNRKTATLETLASAFKNGEGRDFNLQRLSELVAVSDNLLLLKWERQCNKIVLSVSATNYQGDRKKKFRSDLQSITDRDDVNLYTLMGDKIKTAVPDRPKKVRTLSDIKLFNMKL